MQKIWALMMNLKGSKTKKFAKKNLRTMNITQKKAKICNLYGKIEL